MIYIQRTLMRSNREKTSTLFKKKVLLLMESEQELSKYNFKGRLRKGAKPKKGFKDTFPLLTEELKGDNIPVNFKLNLKIVVITYHFLLLILLACLGRRRSSQFHDLKQK